MIWLPSTKRAPCAMLANTGRLTAGGPGSSTRRRASTVAAISANTTAIAYDSVLPPKPTSRPPSAGPVTSAAWKITLPSPAARTKSSRGSTFANNAL